MEQKAPQLLDLTRDLRTCMAPENIKSRTDFEKLASFTDCIRSSISEINLLGINTLEYCSEEVSIGLCSSKMSDDFDNSSKERDLKILRAKIFCTRKEFFSKQQDIGSKTHRTQ